MLGLDLDVVEGRQHLAFANLVALAHRQRLDDAAVAVLYLLEVLIDLDRAGRDHRALQHRPGRPAAATGDQQRAQHDAGDDARPQSQRPFARRVHGRMLRADEFGYIDMLHGFTSSGMDR